MSKRCEFGFSQREMEIIKLIEQRITEEDIAVMLQISIGTVKSHIRSIKKKVGLHRYHRSLSSIIQSIFSEEAKS